MSLGLRKRVYKTVQSIENDDGHGVQLDHRPLRTPAGAALSVPSAGLARAIAEEWDAQRETINPHAMPLTSLTCTAIDLVAQRRDQVIDELADYGATDALCYRAERPPELVDRQDALWQPLVVWADDQLGARLTVTSSLLAVAQPAPALVALRAAVARHDDLALSALATAVKTSGSLLVGLALSRGRLDAAGAFQAAELHETYQVETWGEQPEETRRQAGVRQDLEAAARLIALLAGAAPKG